MLVPHLITALADEDANGTSGKNIVAGAVCTMFDAATGGNAIILYDDESGSNGATSKTTDASGQVVVYATPGEYWKSVNGGTRRKVVVGNVGAFYGTAAEIAALRPIRDGQIAYATDRANAPLISSTTATAQPGDITAANGNVWVLQDLENFRAYGEVDDSTDCGPLIESVLNSGRSNIYKFRGNFTVDTISTVTGISNLTIDCEGAYFDCSNMYGADVQGIIDGLFNINGSRFGTTTITSDMAEGDTSFTVADGAEIKVGSNVYMLSSGELWYTEYTPVTRRFIATVKSVSGNTVTLVESMPFSMDATSHTITIESWEQVENIKLIGGHFWGGNYRRNLGNGVGIGVLTSQFFKNIEASGCVIDGFEGIAIWVKYGYKANVHDISIKGHAEEFPTPTEGVNSGFYGVFFNTTKTCLMDSVSGFRVRHLQDASHSFGLQVSNCNSIDSHRGAFGSHAGVYDGTYLNCKASGDQAGVQWRGMDLIVDSCNFTSFSSGSCIYDSVGSTSDLASVRKVSNCKLVAARHAVSFNGGNIDISISNSNLVGGGEGSGYAVIDLNVCEFRSCFITDNERIEMSNGSGVAISVSQTNGGIFKLKNNLIKSDLNLLRVFSPSSSSSLFIEDNIFDSDGSGFYDININNAQTFENIVNNYRPDGTQATRTP